MDGKQLLNQHVEFKFLRNAYPLNEKLFCYFQSPNASQWQPEVGDWVGLYKVGWSTLKEHKVRKQIQQEWLENRRNVNVDYVHLVFEQHEIPSEEGLYQFVYVTKGDAVKGVSMPFRFERVVSKLTELRDMIDVLKPEVQLYQQQVQQQTPEQILQRAAREHRYNQLLRLGGERETIVGRIESELAKECQRLNLNESINGGKIMQKYLNNIRLAQNDDVTKKVEELFVENGKLCMSLKTRIQEVSELKKECDDIKTVNVELLNKLSTAESKVDQLQRERELNVRRIEEITRDLPRVGLDKLQSSKQLIQDLEETTRWFLQQEEVQQPIQELKRSGSLYNNVELEVTPSIVDARIKLVKIETPVQQQQQQEQQQFYQRLQQQEQQQQQPRRGHLIEKILREVDGAPSQVRLLKRVIEDLKSDNELLRERVRQVEGSEATLTSLPIKQEVTVLPRSFNLVPMEFIGQQQQPTVNIEGQSVLPSISVSTTTMNVPEQQQQQPLKQTTKSYIVAGKQLWEQQQQQPRQWQSVEQQQQQQQPRQWQSVEQQQQQQPRQWQSVEQQQQPRQWQFLFEQRQGEQQQQQQAEQKQPRQWQSVEQWQHQVQQQQQQQQQQKQHLRGQVGEYLNRLDEQIRNKIEERLRNKLQEQLQGKLEQQQQQQQQQRQLYKFDDLVRQQLQKSTPQQWSSLPLSEVIIPSTQQQQQQQRWSQQQQQVEGKLVRDELNVVRESTPTGETVQAKLTSTMCPVCGIAMPNELNVCDFEIHVNSHFTD